HLHQLRRAHRNGGIAAGNRQRSAPRAPGPLGRRAGTFRPFLQLLEEREHSDHPRTRAEERERNAEDEKLRQKVAQRNQGYTDQDGPQPGHEVRRARTDYLAAAAKPDGAAAERRYGGTVKKVDRRKL